MASGSLILWFHLHCLTWLVYALYLLSLFSQGERRNSLAWFGFVAVHVSFIAVSLVIHTVPPNCSSQNPLLGLGLVAAAGASVLLTCLLFVWKQRGALRTSAPADDSETVQALASSA